MLLNEQWFTKESAESSIHNFRSEIQQMFSKIMFLPLWKLMKRQHSKYNEQYFPKRAWMYKFSEYTFF